LVRSLLNKSLYLQEVEIFIFRNQEFLRFTYFLVVHLINYPLTPTILIKDGEQICNLIGNKLNRKISTGFFNDSRTFSLIFVFWFIYCKRFLIIDLKGIEWESKWKVSSSRTLCVRSHRAFFVFFNNLCISRTFPFLFIQMLLFQIKNQDIYLFL